ncbi:MAG: hypothetical protein IKR73_02685 [Oscillospiraceae bacterium]|nr:hypothetical protein [Oscillospiraceae bacterium]
MYIKRAASAGIICEIVYFLSVTAFIVLHTEWALTLWEIMTVAGAAVMLGVMDAIADIYGITGTLRRYMDISLSGTLFLTAAAHFTSIGVTRPLVSQGIAIPDFVKIGTHPGYEMTIDYTAWGLFMGCAFLFLCMGVKDRRLKILSGICSVLCLCGFIGSFFAEGLWYAAPMGYGIGFLIMCIFELRSSGADPAAH